MLTYVGLSCGPHLLPWRAHVTVMFCCELIGLVLYAGPLFLPNIEFPLQSLPLQSLPLLATLWGPEGVPLAVNMQTQTAASR